MRIAVSHRPIQFSNSDRLDTKLAVRVTRLYLVHNIKHHQHNFYCARPNLHPNFYCVAVRRLRSTRCDSRQTTGDEKADVAIVVLVLYA